MHSHSLEKQQSIGRIKRDKYNLVEFEDAPLPPLDCSIRPFKGTNTYGRGLSPSFIMIDECAFMPAYIFRNIRRRKFNNKKRNRKGLR